jgi:hypothetical protein
MNSFGSGNQNALPASCGGAIHYAVGTDGLLYWWDIGRVGDLSHFFFHSADVPDGLMVGSITPVLVPGQQ